MNYESKKLKLTDNWMHVIPRKAQKSAALKSAIFTKQKPLYLVVRNIKSHHLFMHFTGI